MVDLFNTNYIGKTIKVAFDDGERVAIRKGVCRGKDGSLIYLDTSDGMQSLHLNRIIRVEVIE